MKMMRHSMSGIPVESLRTQTFWSWSRGVALCLLAAVAIAGCKKKDEAAPAAAATPEPPPPPSADLTAKWPVGKRLVRHVEFTQEINLQPEGAAPPPTPPPERGRKGKGRMETGTAAPQPGATTTTRTQDIALSVLKARDGGGVEIEAEILSEAIETKKDGRRVIGFDSKADVKSDRTNVIAGPLRKLVGARIKMLTDSTGKVESVEGLPDLFRKVTAGTSAQAQAVARGLMAEPVLKELAPLAFGLPNKSVNKGDTWAQDIPLAGTSIQVSLNFTFKDLEERDGKKLALVEYTGTLTSPANSQSSGFTIEVEKGALNGKLWFDPSLGLNIEQNSESQVTMKISSTKGATTTDSTQKTTSKLVEIADLNAGNAKTGDSKAGDEKAKDAKMPETKGADAKPAESPPPVAAKQP